MAPKDAKKHMKAEQKKKRKLQTTTDPTPRKYSVVPTTFFTYPRIAVSIIAIILFSNPKPYVVDRAVWKQVTLIFSCFYLV
jgi:hypothetical protein